MGNSHAKTLETGVEADVVMSRLKQPERRARFTSPRRGEVGLSSNPGEGSQIPRGTLTPHPICYRKSTSPFGRGKEARCKNATKSPDEGKLGRKAPWAVIIRIFREGVLRDARPL